MHVYIAEHYIISNKSEILDCRWNNEEKESDTSPTLYQRAWNSTRQPTPLVTK